MKLLNNTLGPALAASMVLTAILIGAAPASAQTYNYGSYGVANVSVANGNVTIIRGDSGQQAAATVNAPLVAGDYIATGPGSDAEVQFDGVSMLRLASNTQVRFVNLSPGSREMQLAAGTVDLAELQGSDGGPQLDTPPLSVRPNQTGDYRVSVLGNGETLVTVRNGAATISSENGSSTLTPGSTLVAYGNSISQQAPVAFDSFDQFNISRDQSMQTAYNANPYISPQLAGYSNFANYGQWQNVPGYGYAWAPNNQSATNFAPYQNGQWVWEPGYGYTWVDNAPYGYATSHYGTWFNNPNYGGWLWQPPASQYQNSPTNLASAWLPAAVAFFLSGNNGGSLGSLSSLLGNFPGLLGASSTANIGWIPLAPGEPYQPWYGTNYAYPQTGLSNVTNVTNVYNVYSNARYYRGVTMVPVTAWRQGNFHRLVVVQPRQIRQIVLIRGAVPVVPTTQNLYYARTVVVHHPVTLSHAFSAPRLAARAPAVAHISFKTQQAKIQSIAAVRPKEASLPVRHTTASHPVYQPVKHAPVHVSAFKPVPHHVAPAAKTAPHTAAKPAPRPVTPVANPEAHHAAPASKPAPRPVTPVEKPAVHHEAPAPKPVTHPAAKAEPRPVTPVPKPVHPAVPPAHPAAKPATHPAPAAKPASHPAPAAKPAAKPASEAHPKPNPEHPQPKASPSNG